MERAWNCKEQGALFCCIAFLVLSRFPYSRAPPFHPTSLIIKAIQLIDTKHETVAWLVAFIAEDVRGLW